jgi:hypothetical protein
MRISRRSSAASPVSPARPALTSGAQAMFAVPPILTPSTSLGAE